MDSLSVREERSRISDFYASLMEICDKLCKYSNGRMILVFGEKDDTQELETERETYHFVKLDGKRITRDIEMFDTLSRISDKLYSSSDFLEDIFNIKELCPDAFEGAKEYLIHLSRYFPEQHRRAWEYAFEEHGDEDEMDN